MDINTLRGVLMACGGVLGGTIGILWGGWTPIMTTLIILMAMDFIGGFLVAFAFNRSPNTTDGLASSYAMWVGLARKVGTMALVALAYQIGIHINMAWLKDATAMAFIFNEALSIVENAGLMGILIPKVLKQGIQVLEQESEKRHDSL